MKKRLLLVLGILIAGLLSWMGYSSIKKLDKKAESDNIVQNLDSLTSKLKIHQIVADKETIFIYFNSDCHFCQWEMKELQKHIDEFEDFQLVLASFEHQEDALSFLAKHDLAQYYAHVNPDLLSSTIMRGVPQTFIYQNGQLKKHFTGQVKIEAILEVLK